MKSFWRRFTGKSSRGDLTSEDHAALARVRERLIAAMSDYQGSRGLRPPVEIFLGTRVVPDTREEIDTMLAAFLGRRAAIRLRSQS